MKHATSRMLFAYWDTLRAERAAPERSDIVPGAIRQILADTFILAIEPGAQAEFRLAGTRCAALFGGSLKDRTLASLWREPERLDVGRQIDIVASETAGLVAGLVGETRNGCTVELELVLLPLRHRGATSARILGALSPLVIPSWIGLVPLASLETRTLRVVAPQREHRPAIAASDRPASRRKHLVVLQGGLS